MQTESQEMMVAQARVVAGSWLEVVCFSIYFKGWVDSIVFDSKWGNSIDRWIQCRVWGREVKGWIQVLLAQTSEYLEVSVNWDTQIRGLKEGEAERGQNQQFTNNSIWNMLSLRYFSGIHIEM